MWLHLCHASLFFLPPVTPRQGHVKLDTWTPKGRGTHGRARTHSVGRGGHTAFAYCPSRAVASARGRRAARCHRAWQKSRGPHVILQAGR